MFTNNFNFIQFKRYQHTICMDEKRPSRSLKFDILSSFNLSDCNTDFSAIIDLTLFVRFQKAIFLTAQNLFA